MSKRNQPKPDDSAIIFAQSILNRLADCLERLAGQIASGEGEAALDEASATMDELQKEISKEA